MVARRFDEGFKNYLTKEERNKAVEAVKNVSYRFLKFSLIIYRAMKRNLFGMLKLEELNASIEF